MWLLHALCVLKCLEIAACERPTRQVVAADQNRNILGRVVQTLGPWVLVIHTFSPSLAGERLTDFNICNVKQTISFAKARVLEYLSRIVMQDVSNGVHYDIEIPSKCTGIWPHGEDLTFVPIAVRPTVMLKRRPCRLQTVQTVRTVQTGCYFFTSTLIF